ncbi:hypothetical protein BD309DRAFT_620649 [Dichomitus squalens]|nr:hypothetical protein BD309DRAFT_620649 [Dichomitus squalens]
MHIPAPCREGLPIYVRNEDPVQGCKPQELGRVNAALPSTSSLESVSVPRPVCHALQADRNVVRVCQSRDGTVVGQHADSALSSPEPDVFKLRGYFAIGPGKPLLHCLFSLEQHDQRGILHLVGELDAQAVVRRRRKLSRRAPTCASFPLGQMLPLAISTTARNTPTPPN